MSINTDELRKDLSLEEFKKEVLADYSLANLSRNISIAGRREVLTGKAKFGIFGDGKELPQIALAKQFKDGDWRSGYYRDQTWMMAAGLFTAEEFFHQLYGNTDGELNPGNGGRSFNNHFSTIGVNGMNEMIRNFSNDKHTIADTFGTQMAMRILDFMRDQLKEFQERSGNLYNLEATPAEGTTYRFAKEDAKRYDDIIQAGTKENNYYTNSSQIPVFYTDDPFEALTLQDDLQCKYTGGTVLHLYMREKVSSAEAGRKLVRNVISNFRLPYITVTPTFSICEKHGYLSGEHEFCPKCDEELLQKGA